MSTDAPQTAPETIRQPLWLHRWPWLLLLVVTAVVCFGSYHRHGINFRDEGGTLTLLGQRLLAGEVPFRDVELSYNVGWFAPIVALFRVTGVDFVALRVFFFALSGLAAVVAFLMVEKAARHAGRHRMALPLAFFCGVMLVLVPGMTFKNYNPLAVVANTSCLLGFVLAGRREGAWRWAAGAGLVLGATWLVRIDLGTFFSLLWLGVLVLRTIEGYWKNALIALGMVTLSTVAFHAPALWHASQHGYSDSFTAAYTSHWKMLRSKVPGLRPAAAKPVKPAPTATAAPAQPTAPEPLAWKADTLQRVSWADVLEADAKKKPELLGLYLLTYLPLCTVVPLVLWAAWNWLRGLLRREDITLPLAVLVLLGGALTLFPQFFLWRPDAPHLSEFGPGFWAASLAVTGLLGLGQSWRSPLRWMGLFLALHAAVWLWRMVPDRWCGTMAARASRNTWFEGENGVRIYETRKTAAWMKKALAVIRAHSAPGEYLVAYPYHPAFNVLANRPTYERELYVDNADAKPRWSAAAIERIEKYQPAIVIVSDWDINGTDASRFKNWAAPVYAYLRANYDLAGTFDEKEKFEVFVRRKATPQP